MMILEFFIRNKECQHGKVKPDMDLAYCPDCGELIENQWYLVRCSCCGVKLKGMMKNGEIVPEKKFCHNCGVNSFVVQKLDKINFVDIRYSVLVKAIIKNQINSVTQSWIDPKMSMCGRRLIGKKI